MALQYVYQSSFELQEIEKNLLPRFTDQRPIFKHFPIESVQEALLIWEQEDDYVGLQNLRGYNQPPTRVNLPGKARYIMQPGVYGDVIPLDELTMTQRSQSGTLGAPINVEDLVARAQEQLLLRRLDRQEQILWALASSGTFSVANGSNGVIHTDSYPIREFTATVPWSTWATAKPLADMRQLQFMSRGFSVDFGPNAAAYMNRTTAQNLLQNTNAVDIYGKRTAGLATANSLPEINKILMGEDLPPLVVYDQGYKDDAGRFILYIPDNTVVVVGNRPGNVPIGAYRMTRNINNPSGAAGAYTFVSDNSGRSVPRTLEAHDGHNGGPVIKYPSAIVILHV